MQWHWYNFLIMIFAITSTCYTVAEAAAHIRVKEKANVSWIWPALFITLVIWMFTHTT